MGTSSALAAASSRWERVGWGVVGRVDDSARREATEGGGRVMEADEEEEEEVEERKEVEGREEGADGGIERSAAEAIVRARWSGRCRRV